MGAGIFCTLIPAPISIWRGLGRAAGGRDGHDGGRREVGSGKRAERLIAPRLPGRNRTVVLGDIGTVRRVGRGRIRYRTSCRIGDAKVGARIGVYLPLGNCRSGEGAVLCPEMGGP